jgi:PRC-barrel domain
MMQTDSTSLEPHDLTASDRLEGTPVRNMDGTTIGTMERVIIDQLSGNLACVVLSFNGSVGRRRLPIPCSRITYDRKLAAFNVDLTKQELNALADRSDWDNRGRECHGDEVNRYWGIAETWSTAGSNGSWT